MANTLSLSGIEQEIAPAFGNTPLGSALAAGFGVSSVSVAKNGQVQAQVSGNLFSFLTGAPVTTGGTTIPAQGLTGVSPTSLLMWALGGIGLVSLAWVYTKNLLVTFFAGGGVMLAWKAFNPTPQATPTTTIAGVPVPTSAVTGAVKLAGGLLPTSVQGLFGLAPAEQGSSPAGLATSAPGSPGPGAYSFPTLDLSPITALSASGVPAMTPAQLAASGAGPAPAAPVADSASQTIGVLAATPAPAPAFALDTSSFALGDGSSVSDQSSQDLGF